MNVAVSERLTKLPPYLFADIRRKIAEARAKGIEVITLGIGDPDSPTSRGYLCSKGKAAPQILYHPDRLTHPVKRVGPRGGEQMGARIMG